MHSIHHVQKVPGCCRCPKRLHSLWSRLSVLMLSMLLCHCGWLTLPPCHLIVCLFPPCHLIVCLLFLNYSMVYCCFFDCIGRNEVMRLDEGNNDAINSTTIGCSQGLNCALSNDLLKKSHFLTYVNALSTGTGFYITSLIYSTSTTRLIHTIIIILLHTPRSTMNDLTFRKKRKKIKKKKRNNARMYVCTRSTS